MNMSWRRLHTINSTDNIKSEQEFRRVALGVDDRCTSLPTELPYSIKRIHEFCKHRIVVFLFWKF